MSYATIEDVEAGFRLLNSDERDMCSALIKEAGLLIDAVAVKSEDNIKNVVTCRMIRRAIGNGNVESVPMGATQGSVSALGYSQSWTMSNGSSGELYLSKLEKQMLGVGNKIGSYSPVEELVAND